MSDIVENKLFKGKTKDYWFKVMLDFCAENNLIALTEEEFDKIWDLNFKE